MTSIDEVLECVVVAIYTTNSLKNQLYLKGGQALRLAYKIDNRFSSDADFSVAGKILNHESFFDQFKKSLYNEFFNNDLYLFDFKVKRRPEIKKDGIPDFWSGWGIEFKLIQKKYISLPIIKQRKQAIIPKGSESPAIKIDISEYEYCDPIETIKFKSTKIKVYSKLLIVIEKIRAICQGHPKYKLKGTTSSRARDYYDIERIVSKEIELGRKREFAKKSAEQIHKVFKAKEVPLSLLDEIFEENYTQIQKSNWNLVKGTVSGYTDEFDFYNEFLKDFVSELKKHL